MNLTLYGVSAVRGCSKCERLSHISLQQFTKPMNSHTGHLFFGGIMFIIGSTFFIHWKNTIQCHPEYQVLNLVLDKGRLFYFALKSIVFYIFQHKLKIFQVTRPIAFSDYHQVTNVCTDKFKPMEHFINFLLEISRGVTNPHRQEFAPVLYPGKYDPTQVT